MHSSRMRTGRSLTVCGGGGELVPPSGGDGGGGCLLPGGVPPSRGCLLPGGCPSGGCLLPGGLLPGGGIPACTEADPPVDRITDTSKNITLATTSLRQVTNAKVL